MRLERARVDDSVMKVGLLRMHPYSNPKSTEASHEPYLRVYESFLSVSFDFTRERKKEGVGPELKQENRGETKHQLFGGCFAWHSKVETKQEISYEFTFRFT